MRWSSVFSRGRRPATMLFVRTYQGMLGGHLKVFDYMGHVAASALFKPSLYLTPQSVKPPAGLLPQTVRVFDRPVEAAAYFVAGMNWQLFDQAGVDTNGKPVVNLVQGLRHALPGDPRRAFLTRRALRICVSPAVEQAVRATGLANGPLLTIRNGLDISALCAFNAPVKHERVFIAGVKNAAVAQALAQELTIRGIETDTCCTLIPREEFLARMGRSRIAVCLPDPHDGFFLPALEAMALDCVVVMPHCEGAKTFCIDGTTCVATAYTPQALADAVARVWSNDGLENALRLAGKSIAAEHSLERERQAFIAALTEYVAEPA